MLQNRFLCHQKYMDIALRATSLLSEELSVDLLRYIGEMLFELFSMLCSVIIIIKILFITHTCTTAYTIHIYVFIYHKMLSTSFTYVGKDLHIQRYVVHKIHIYVCYMQLYMCV